MLFKRNNIFPELPIKSSGFPQDFLRSKKASSCNNLAASIERQHFLKIKADVSVAVLDLTLGSKPPFYGLSNVVLEETTVVPPVKT